MLKETEQPNQHVVHNETYESFCKHSGGIYINNKCISNTYESFKINPYLISSYILVTIFLIF